MNKERHEMVRRSGTPTPQSSFKPLRRYGSGRACCPPQHLSMQWDARLAVHAILNALRHRNVHGLLEDGDRLKGRVLVAFGRFRFDPLEEGWRTADGRIVQRGLDVEGTGVFGSGKRKCFDSYFFRLKDGILQHFGGGKIEDRFWPLASAKTRPYDR